MYWLNITWITENWVPLLVTLVLGYILGWLITGMSPARRVRELEARNAELENKQRKTESELTALRNDTLTAKNNLTAALADVDAARNNNKALEEKVAALEAAAAAAAVADTDGAAAAEEPPTEEMPVVEATPEEAAPAAVGEFVVDEAAAADDKAELMKQTLAPGLAPDQVAESFATVARTPEAIEADNAREIVLREAMARAGRLQDELDQRNAMLAAHQAELESLKAELLASSAARHELDNRLVRAREDVASELAVLASTMIKMKDDALARAEARNAALKAELDAAHTEIESLQTIG